MLFTIIRDFFVNHVWGGHTSTGGTVACSIGNISYVNPNDSNNFNYFTSNWYVPVGSNQLGDNFMCFGDWLSTISTIITLVLILVCIAFFIRWIFKVCSNAILLR